MNFELNETSKIDFAISIAGTQMRPTEVRVVLGDAVRLVFTATSDDGVNYSALVTPLKDVVTSICLFTIEVLFGNKIFVPIRRQVTINNGEIAIQVFDNSVQQEIEPDIASDIEQQIEVPTEVAQQIEVPVKQENAPIEFSPVTEEIKKPAPINDEDIKAKVSAFADIFESVANIKAPPKTSTKIQTLPSKLPKFEKTKHSIKLPKLIDKKPTGVEVDKIKVAKSIFTEEIKSPVKKQPKSKAPVVKVLENVNSSVTFSKDEVIYQ